MASRSLRGMVSVGSHDIKTASAQGNIKNSKIQHNTQLLVTIWLACLVSRGRSEPQTRQWFHGDKVDVRKGPMQETRWPFQDENEQNDMVRLP
jgi:hypothetical protein